MIAKLTFGKLLPQAHVSSEAIRQLRGVLRLRSFLVNQRRGTRNQIQTLLDRNLWPSERPQNFKSPFCKRGLGWLSNLSLPSRERFILDESLQSFHEINVKIDKIDVFLKSESFDIPGLKYLTSVPGFKSAGINAYIVLLEISDISRFEKSKGLVYYAGLLPRQYSSGDKQRLGSLVKGANMHLRTALIESTFAAIRQNPIMKSHYGEVKKNAGSGAAVIATARKLCCAIYYVLKEQKSFNPEFMKDTSNSKTNSLKPSTTACHA
jgi:transposase